MFYSFDALYFKQSIRRDLTLNELIPRKWISILVRFGLPKDPELISNLISSSFSAQKSSRAFAVSLINFAIFLVKIQLSRLEVAIVMKSYLIQRTEINTTIRKKYLNKKSRKFLWNFEEKNNKKQINKKKLLKIEYYIHNTSWAVHEKVQLLMSE